MHLGIRAALTPNQPAVVMAATGEALSYAELEAASNRLAHAFRAHGLQPGDRVAFLLENRPEFFVVAWAAQRAGLYYTPLHPRLTAAEIDHILADGRPGAFVASAPALVAASPAVDAHGADLRLVIGGLAGGAGPAVGADDADQPDGFDGSPTRFGVTDPDISVWVTPERRDAFDAFDDFDAVLASYAPTPIEDESEGGDLLYSSGTTGRPKAVKRPLTHAPWGTPSSLTLTVQELYGCDDITVFLSPGPLAHAAPLRFSLAMHRLGGTVVLMDSFDPLRALAAIERHRVTHSLWVPTMFKRLLMHPPADRRRYDLASHRVAIHGAGPCPVRIKEQMIAWWGPILHEYYAGTEGNGYVGCTSEEWQQRPGTVGRSHRGPVHILDDSGNEVATSTSGTVFFETTQPFEYEGDPDATTRSRDPRGRGWTTLGDVGHLDADGYLFLTDRNTFVINAGGINVYPQEAENVLMAHPQVTDAAVFGVPDDDLGERATAVVQPAPGVDPGPELAQELLAYCRTVLAAYKCPRAVDFRRELPRDAAGKLAKHALRAAYLRAASQASASS